MVVLRRSCLFRFAVYSVRSRSSAALSERTCFCSLRFFCCSSFAAFTAAVARDTLGDCLCVLDDVLRSFELHFFVPACQLRELAFARLNSILSCLVVLRLFVRSCTLFGRQDNYTELALVAEGLSVVLKRCTTVSEPLFVWCCTFAVSRA